MSKERKNPHARTVERFKYRNAAVMQGGILGVDKLVLITMCEFAHDDGILYHGIRSLAVATGLKKDRVARSIKRLCELYGVVLLIEKGRGRRHASRYKILIDAMPEITVYEVVKAKNRKENEKPAAEASRGKTVETVSTARQSAVSTVSPGEQLNSTVSSERQFDGNRLTEGTKDVDVAFKMLTQVEGKHVNTLGTDAPRLAPEEQNQKQHQPRPQFVSKSKATPTPPRNAPPGGGDRIDPRRPFCRSCGKTQPAPPATICISCSRDVPIQTDDPSKPNYVRPL